MKVKEALRAVGVFNTHELLRRFADNGKDVSCSFHGAGDTRSMVSAGTRVYSPSHKTDPEAHFMENGCKKFLGCRAESMPIALAWASKRYGIREWATDPTNPAGKVPLAVRERALAAIVAERRKNP